MLSDAGYKAMDYPIKYSPINNTRHKQSIAARKMPHGAQLPCPSQLCIIDEEKMKLVVICLDIDDISHHKVGRLDTVLVAL